MGGGGGKVPDPAPVLEPIKSADESMREASQEASRAQQLRRGLSSTFSRSSMSGPSGGSTATAGASKKLGA